jgi:hypothetical protein
LLIVLAITEGMRQVILSENHILIRAEGPRRKVAWSAVEKIVEELPVGPVLPRPFITGLRSVPLARPISEVFRRRVTLHLQDHTEIRIEHEWVAGWDAFVAHLRREADRRAIPFYRKEKRLTAKDVRETLYRVFGIKGDVDS